MSNTLVIVVNLPVEMTKFGKLLSVLSDIDPKAVVNSDPKSRSVPVTGWLIETGATPCH